MSVPIRTLKLSNGRTVSLARSNELLVLAVQPQPTSEVGLLECDDAPMWAVLSSIPPEDPFPGYSMDGHEMFWIKTYSENEGLLEQLIKAGWLRRTGRDLKQAYVTFPMCELRLDEQEVAHQCPTCDRFESITDEQRFKRCSKCHKRYYCSTEHQQEDWPRHKFDCKDLAAGRLAHVENRRRRESYGLLKSMDAAPELNVSLNATPP